MLRKQLFRKGRCHFCSSDLKYKVGNECFTSPPHVLHTKLLQWVEHATIEASFTTVIGHQSILLNTASMISHGTLVITFFLERIKTLRLCELTILTMWMRLLSKLGISSKGCPTSTCYSLLFSTTQNGIWDLSEFLNLKIFTFYKQAQYASYTIYTFKLYMYL